MNETQFSSESIYSQYHANLHRPDLDLLQHITDSGTKSSALRFGLGVVVQVPLWAMKHIARHGWTFGNAPIETREAALPEPECIPSVELNEPDQLADDIEADQLQAEDLADDIEADQLQAEDLADDIEAENEAENVPEEEPKPLVEEALPEWARPHYRQAKEIHPTFGVGYYSSRALIALALIYSISFTPHGCYQTREFYLECHLSDYPTLPFAERTKAQHTELVALMLLAKGEDLSEEQLE